MMQKMRELGKMDAISGSFTFFSISSTHLKHTLLRISRGFLVRKGAEHQAKTLDNRATITT